MQSAHCRQPVGPEAVTNSRGMWLFLPTGRASAQWSGLWAMAEPYCFSQGRLSVSSTDGTVMMSRIHPYLINFSKHETAWLFTGLWTVSLFFRIHNGEGCSQCHSSLTVLLLGLLAFLGTQCVRAVMASSRASLQYTLFPSLIPPTSRCPGPGLIAKWSALLWWVWSSLCIRHSSKLVAQSSNDWLTWYICSITKFCNILIQKMVISGNSETKIVVLSLGLRRRFKDLFN